jgi:hypothetical protein
MLRQINEVGENLDSIKNLVDGIEDPLQWPPPLGCLSIRFPVLSLWDALWEVTVGLRGSRFVCR